MTDIALVLGGGGARGLAHIHVLEAFDDLGIKPSVMAGSSIGAVMAAGYASGLSAAEIRDFSISTFSNTREVMARLWQLRPATWQSLFTESLPRFGEMNALRVMEAFLPQGLKPNFEDLFIPTKITATDFYGNKLKVIEHGPLLPAVAASAAIPAVFKPEVIDGRVLIDGGIASPVPFELVGDKGELVIAVDVVGMPRAKSPEDEKKIPSRIDAAFGASQLMMQSITNMKMKVHPPDLLIRPPVDRYRVLDFLKAETIITETATVRDEVKRDISNLLEARLKSQT